MTVPSQPAMKLVIASTGASGAIYLQRLLDHLGGGGHEIHLVLTPFAKQVIASEIGALKLPEGTVTHSERTMNAPFASGSALFDAMVIVPCSMGTVARIAAGTSDNLVLRAADVFLKERRRLIVVPRETPFNLIHVRNLLTLIEAGATVLPAMPAFYSNPVSFEALADTVVFRILDQLGLSVPGAYRWGSDE